MFGEVDHTCTSGLWTRQSLCFFYHTEITFPKSPSTCKTEKSKTKVVGGEFLFCFIFTGTQYYTNFLSRQNKNSTLNYETILGFYIKSTTLDLKFYVIFLFSI